MVIGGGGGFSTIEPTPSYQQGVSGTNIFHAVQYLTPTDYTDARARADRADAVELQPDPERDHRLR